MGSKAPNVGRITFALVDVKGGRKALAKLVKDHTTKIPITLSGHIISEWSDDDGTSIEFEVDVNKAVLGAPVPHKCTCIRCLSKRKAEVAGDRQRKAT